MEGFFSSLKTKHTARTVYRSREQARSKRVQLHRTLLQPEAPELDARMC